MTAKSRVPNLIYQSTLIKNFFLLALFFWIGNAFGQSSVSLTAVLNDSLKTIQIDQEIMYQNTDFDTLSFIYLNDWNNSFKDKSTPLAKRFSEDYIRRFHFARKEEWGNTEIRFLADENLDSLNWERPENAPDLIKIKLKSPLLPGESFKLKMAYSIKIPSEKFTRYGYSENGRYKLKNWFITPAVYNNGWQVYSNKNLNDLFAPPLDLDIKISIPKYLAAISALELESIKSGEESKSIHLVGENRLNPTLYLTRNYLFEQFDTGKTSVLTNVDDDGLEAPAKYMIVNRVMDFLTKNLGEYPHEILLVTQEDYLENPMYGLNQLPKFIRPFPDGFGYDLKQLKTITADYLENSLLINPRTEKWVFDAIQTYLMMEYVSENYPDIKILGNLSDVIGIRWFHIADLNFNDQYVYPYMMMARSNMDQPLSTPQDSLVNFNKEIANAYKAGVGLKYLESFLQNNTVSKSIKEFYNSYKLQKTEAEDFVNILENNAGKNIDWFYDEYISTDEKIDFKIKKAKKEGDSIVVSIKNKSQNHMPISLYGLNGDKIVYKKWVENVYDLKKVTIPANSIDRVALNYEGLIPEINQRDNFYGVSTFFDKPVQFRLFKDIEDPHYNQVFFMPQLQFNLYDGLTFGVKMYNQTVLMKNFEYTIAPMYGSKSKTLVGSASFSHVIQFEDQELYAISYGALANRFSYGYDLFYEKLTPFMTMSFRDSNLRDNKRQMLLIRNVNVYRDQNLMSPFAAPDYSVFNINYSYSDPGMVDYLTGKTDFQLAKQFSKFSVTMEYRKLFKNNRQINLRFFGGAFLYNDLTDSNYFSFALDRPTDYLYDYNYYGRSETSGLFSQQIIMAEGGFKSQLEPEFANQWLTTVNASTNIWKWIYAYGDLGVVKNKNQNAKVVYDSGIRLSFIADYFEIYFPVYSSLGWEINQENYDQRIRFIATLNVSALVKLFSREWY